MSVTTSLRNRTLLVIGILSFSLWSLTAIGPGHATIYNIFESGTQVFDSSSSNSFTGVQSQMVIYNQTLGDPGDAIFHVVSLDYVSGSTHYWLQTGYAYGTLQTSCETPTPPCGGAIFYSQPQFFYEYNIAGAYSFEVVSPAAWTTTSPAPTWDTFSILLSGSTGSISIDGITRATVPNAFSGGTPSAFTEVHQVSLTAYVTSASGCPPCYALAYWQNIQYHRGSTWSLFPGCTNFCSPYVTTSVACNNNTCYEAGFVADSSAASQEVSEGVVGGGGCRYCE